MAVVHYIFDDTRSFNPPSHFLGLYSVDHPLLTRATKHVQSVLLASLEKQYPFKQAGHGKMFGVLIVEDQEQRPAVLYAFEGQMMGQWNIPGFVPPVFAANQEVEKDYSRYVLTNYLGERKSIAELSGVHRPFPGTGDCASTKLVNYANANGLKPIAITEFWWGAMPEDEVRHHGRAYCPCRGRCHPLMAFMLEGMEVEPKPDIVGKFNDSFPETVYEDDDLVVINKPHGMLSVPGKEHQDSVYQRIKTRYPKASGPLLVHRLDMSTSGLILIAKSLEMYRALQNQFVDRTVEKRYVAILSRVPEGKTGVVDLPVRVDLNDRPRQMVCYQYGKPSVSRWELVKQSQGRARVYFYPETGRTHQLRVHAAHIKGLNSPIVGDELYGDADVRLYLHAERLVFFHPGKNERMEILSSAPF
jgi:tRNA pseudouridine32 synthase/23S rRNA pseudouridine746 synthase